MVRILGGPRWQGGKNANNPSGIGKWVRGLLPQWEYEQVYVEPYCGMLGMLLARPACKNELINDIDNRVVNFWHVIRDQPDEFQYLLHHTPWAETEFSWATEAQWDTSETPLRRALALVVVCSSFHARSDFIWGAQPNSGAWASIGHEQRRPWDALARRLKHVTIMERDASDILKQTSEEARAVIYCDPPYRNTKNDFYVDGVVAPDIDEMVSLLKIQKGRVAISGYGDEWDILGWQKHEKETYTALGATRTDNAKASPRIESVWTNYNAFHQPTLDGLID